MNMKVRETSEQWVEEPRKVVGRRRAGVVNLERGAGFLRMGADRGIRIPGRPKGVFRFSSHEEANPWQTNHQANR
jgi:hypothetical protein